MTDKPPRSKIVTLRGQALDVSAAQEPPEVAEARRAKEQLAHWGPRAVRYVALVETEEGTLAFCASTDNSADTLEMAAVLWKMAQDLTFATLTGEVPAYEDADEDDAG
jgi:hypothetical protein